MKAFFHNELLSMRQLSSSIGEDEELHDLSFQLYPGETHIVLSTSSYNHRNFCYLLCGNIVSYTGQFQILGEPMSAHRKLERCIQVIGLEPIIFPALSVAENVAVCSLHPRWFVKSNAISQCLALMNEIGVSMDITKRITLLTQDEQKIVELLRICSMKPPIVVFFDAINYLSEERRGLIPRVIHWLKRNRCGIIYLTSSFEEALELGDRISILDSGTIRGTFLVEDARSNPGDIAHLLSGWQPLTAATAEDADPSTREAIASIDNILYSSSELKRMLGHVATDLVKTLNASTSIVYLVDEARLNVIDVISSEESKHTVPILQPAEVLSLLLQNGPILYPSSKCENLRFSNSTGSAETIVFHPVRLDGKKNVLIQLCFAYHREADPQLINYLKIFSREIAMAVETSRLLGNSVLLQETHHRIKNHLQMVHNLLYLQKIDVQCAKEVDVSQVLDTAMHRIKCISSVHALLCQDWYGRNVVNLRTLVHEILNMYEDMDAHIQADLDDESIPYNDAISFGLVTSELLSNCIHHAFPHNWPDPQIHLRLLNTGIEIILIVQDNGIGISPDFNPNTATSVGMSIIRSIIHDLHGTLRYTRLQPHGTEVQVRFSRSSTHPLVSVDD